MDRREKRRVLLAVALWTPVLLFVGITEIFSSVTVRHTAMARITLYNLKVPVSPGDRLTGQMVSDWAMIWPKEAGGPQAVGAGDSVTDADLKDYLGKPFARAVKADTTLTKDMFEATGPAGAGLDH